MASGRSKSVRFQDNIDKDILMASIESAMSMSDHKMNARNRLMQRKELSRVFSEDYDASTRKIFDPRGPSVNRWNKMFLVACLISLFVDPFFFYLPEAKKDKCIAISAALEVSLTTIRSMVDAFYIIHIFIRFQTAYVAPSSRVFGRGELVIDPSTIASRYLQKHFWLDLLAALPLPQVLIIAVIPNLRGSQMIASRQILRLVIIFQYLLRLCHIFPLSSEIVKANGLMMEKAWAGAAYNLMLYMLASHVLGSSWYLLAIERQDECWKKACNLEFPYCHYRYLDCQTRSDPVRAAWFRSSNLSTLCDKNSDFFQFGIFADALTLEMEDTKFLSRYYYCLWWGLRNLSSLGQNLLTSTQVGEINFAVIIAILGLVLFALLIGNMQTYLQSTTLRLEEWRIRRTDTERWMHHRQLPRHLKQSVRRHEQFRWVATRGVDEESILRDLPVDIRRDIKRHLCLNLVRQVPLFDQMDERVLDAICERLKPSLCTQGTLLVREGDPVTEMRFIIRGRLDSCTTNGGRSGFFNCCRIGPGDFCGEELLPWALDPRPSVVLPSSTRTVKALTEVEAFALIAEDLKFVAAQFRRLHSKQLRHTFRFHSHQWRAWAACFIQAAWFRYKRRKEASELNRRERARKVDANETTTHFSAPLHLQTLISSSVAMHKAAKLGGSSRKGGSLRYGSELDILGSLRKPLEPDFSTVEDW
ncbi:LOW QUALITY PROTEIN: protein CNGC15a-like [Prosopis cineraria]|uniref:LOW QUALITY PROTEIN: protein CNGC15a-like n=1 Tax=Prosopis cineraria TaxID=364024 RepID=UPI00240FB4E4|nr:LOW QUALITY PROTEIN: protein CNGC15a-like [Prosopis cineraria]